MSLKHFTFSIRTSFFVSSLNGLDVPSRDHIERRFCYQHDDGTDIFFLKTSKLHFSVSRHSRRVFQSDTPWILQFEKGQK